MSVGVSVYRLRREHMSYCERQITLSVAVWLAFFLLLAASGYVPGGSGTTIHKKKHKITRAQTQDNTRHTKLQTQCTQNYKHNTTQ